MKRFAGIAGLLLLVGLLYPAPARADIFMNEVAPAQVQPLRHYRDWRLMLELRRVDVSGQQWSRICAIENSPDMSVGTRRHEIWETLTQTQRIQVEDLMDSGDLWAEDYHSGNWFEDLHKRSWDPEDSRWHISSDQSE